MKNLKKILGMIAMFIGLTALCAVDSEVPLWVTLLICLVGIAGLLGGGALYCNNSNQPEID